ncbi:MAG: ATP-grasp domain-containing protein [Candidatus Marinimicrobia bacterium]|nr:ATP-grasp domain-containing protein [Candidatus Neomarinimicrobiota bacterium]
MDILLTSVGRRTYMVEYFKEALNHTGLVHAANSVETYAMKVADRSVVTPLIYNSSYIGFLLDYCLTNKVEAIIPLFDIDLPILSRNKDEFAANGITIVVADPDFIKICNDKWFTFNFFKSNRFRVPETYLSLSSALEAVSDNIIQYPLIIKPRWGMGSIGIFQADNREELKMFYRKTLNSINGSYLKYESQKAPEDSVIIQEKLCGGEYGIDIFNDLDGRLLTCVPKKKLAMRAGETDSAEILENRKLFEIGKTISSLAKHIGNLDIDCFFIENEFYVLEMNCRFGGQYPFSHMAGVNFPKALIHMLLGKKVESGFLKPSKGVIGIKDIVPRRFK